MYRPNGIFVIAHAALLGCESEPPVTTTTTVTRTVTKPGRRPEDVVVTQPPAIRVEAETVAPGPGTCGREGYWCWNGAELCLGTRRWIARPRPAAVWVEGHWSSDPEVGSGWRVIGDRLEGNIKPSSLCAVIGRVAVSSRFAVSSSIPVASSERSKL